MPRVTRTAISLGAVGYPALPLPVNSADIPLTAADATNKEQVAHTEKLVIVARNSGVVDRTVSITSVADTHSRVGDIAAYILNAGDVGIFGPFPASGWRQVDGKLYFEGAHADILFACVLLP